MKGSHPLWDWGQVDVPDEQQRDYLTAAWAAEQLPKLAANDQPFFLAIGFHLPHVPIYASKKWFDLYPLEELQLPPTYTFDRDDLPEIAKQLTLNSTAPRHQWMVENDEWRHAVRAYLAANSFVDHLVGKVLDGLEASNEADNTIVVLWSDHGFHLGEKLRWAKRTLWEETTRVPLIFAGPGIVENAKCSRPVGLIDVYPTLLEACGLPPREELEGESLVRLLADPDADWQPPAICTFGPNNHSLRSERWRYTVYADGSEELYDHESDPNEWHNLAAGPNKDDARARGGDQETCVVGCRRRTPIRFRGVPDRIHRCTAKATCRWAKRCGERSSRRSRLLRQRLTDRGKQCFPAVVPTKRIGGVCCLGHTFHHAAFLTDSIGSSRHTQRQ